MDLTTVPPEVLVPAFIGDSSYARAGEKERGDLHRRIVEDFRESTESGRCYSAGLFCLHIEDFPGWRDALRSVDDSDSALALVRAAHPGWQTAMEPGHPVPMPSPRALEIRRKLKEAGWTMPSRK